MRRSRKSQTSLAQLLHYALWTFVVIILFAFGLACMRVRKGDALPTRDDVILNAVHALLWIAAGCIVGWVQFTWEANWSGARMVDNDASAAFVPEFPHKWCCVACTSFAVAIVIVVETVFIHLAHATVSIGQKRNKYEIVETSGGRLTRHFERTGAY